MNDRLDLHLLVLPDTFAASLKQRRPPFTVFIGLSEIQYAGMTHSGTLSEKEDHDVDFGRTLLFSVSALASPGRAQAISACCSVDPRLLVGSSSGGKKCPCPLHGPGDGRPSFELRASKDRIRQVLMRWSLDPAVLGVF